LFAHRDTHLDPELEVSITATVTRVQWDREQADTQIEANERRWVPGSSIESDSVYLPGHRALVLVADSDLLPPAGCSSAVGLIVVCLMGRQAAVVNWANPPSSPEGNISGHIPPYLPHHLLGLGLSPTWRQNLFLAILFILDT
jgi:hypothetical protein